MSSLILKTAPTAEPVSVSEAKTQSRIDISTDDTYIGTLITAAREAAENYTNRAFISQTWEYYLTTFANSGREFDEIILPKAPLQSVTSVIYTDTDGVSQTLSSSLYTVDAKGEEGRIVPAYGQAWPSTRWVPNAVKVTFIAGYGDAGTAVPAAIKHAILLMVGQYYEQREDLIVGTIQTKMSNGATALLDHHIVRRI